LVDRDVEIIGAVEEPPDLAHAVYRNMDRIGGAVPEIRVMTLKRSGGDWLVLETEELDLIREALRGVGRRREQPRPIGERCALRSSCPTTRLTFSRGLSAPGFR
jgi:hypothetical protein